MSTEQQYAVLVMQKMFLPSISIYFQRGVQLWRTTYRRIYGDWTSTRNNGWKEILLDIRSHQSNNIVIPMENSSDSAMIIDAMDILYGESVDGFILVSSIATYCLASRLRESGMNVIGMGESKTPNAFISACNSFKYLDILYQSLKMKRKKKLLLLKQIIKQILTFP